MPDAIFGSAVALIALAVGVAAVLGVAQIIYLRTRAEGRAHTGRVVRRDDEPGGGQGCVLALLLGALLWLSLGAFVWWLIFR